MLISGNVLNYFNSPEWMASDNPENWEDAKLCSAWREKWHNVRITYDLNSDGYRTNEWDTIDWKNSVVIIGDSCTMGVGVTQETTVSSHLQKQLGRPVINLGVAGSSNMFMLYNAANLIKNVTPYAVVVQWSTADRYVKFSNPNAERGKTGVQHEGAWAQNQAYTRFWIKDDNYLFQNKQIINTMRQLNIKRYLDYDMACAPTEQRSDSNRILAWAGDDENKARDRLHPNGDVFKLWSDTIKEDFEKNGWMD